MYFNDPRLYRKTWDTPMFNEVENRIVEAHTYLRGARIPQKSLGKRVAVYNGKSFKSFIVKPFMIGRKFGEFVLTKKLGRVIHKKKKKKK